MKKLTAILLVFAVLAGPSYARQTGTPASGVQDDRWCTGPSGAEVCVNVDGDLVPTTDSDTDLGSSSLRWANIYGDTIDAGTTLTMPNSTVTTSKLASDAVTSAKISDDQVTTNKIGSGAIDSDAYLDSSIDPDALASSAVTTAKLGDDSVTTAKLFGGAGLTTSAAVLCVVDGRIGQCTTVPVSDGTCTCQ